eukprot:TRINITY_DN166_c2_g1_i3.p1 TRINITY_DN166_c2_g1~~TRINITY_DN166_c2_g1_i3.p1  ORF type:complete len:304 (-),score=107.47 TRINITY_DN166_c2_g1_i3:44-955(-)
MINTLKIGKIGSSLVLFHGFGAGFGFWSPNLDALSRYYTVYAIDMPGFGRNTRTPLEAETPEQAEMFFINTLECWCESMEKLHGLKKFALMGHSMGGYLAACFTMRNEHRVTNLILADPWGVQPQPEDAQKRLPLKLRIVSGIVKSLPSPLAIVRYIGPSLISLIRKDLINKWSTILHGQPEVPANYIYYLNAPLPPSGELAFNKMAPNFAWASRPLVLRMKRALHNEISPFEGDKPLSDSLPICFIYGEYTFMDKRTGRTLAETLGANTTYHLLAGCGHHVYIDDHVNFNSVVLEQLTKTNF